jgi:integral membrane protein (TIGR01906 family)
VALIGIVALVAFDALFELFHRIFFPGGSYAFDPASERLVQLFPFAFWQETAMVVGAVIIALAVVVAVVAGRRSAPRVREAPAGELATAPGSTRS